MSQILTVNKSGLGNFGGCARGRRTASSKRHVLSMRTEKIKNAKKNRLTEDVGVNFKNAGMSLMVMVIFLGIFYLYQVNDLTNKGYEIREIEAQIGELKKENDKNKIKEVELRSMYNIEKTTENLGLIASSDVSYMELNGPVAMK